MLPYIRVNTLDEMKNAFDLENRMETLFRGLVSHFTYKFKMHKQLFVHALTRTVSKNFIFK